MRFRYVTLLQCHNYDLLLLLLFTLFIRNIFKNILKNIKIALHINYEMVHFFRKF